MDPVLRDLMEWATNIVRLPLNPAQRDAVAKQIENFPVNFPPLGDRAGRLILQTDNMKAPRVIAIPQTNRRLNKNSAPLRLRAFALKP